MSPIYRGTAPVLKCYRGAVEVSAVYRGAALVWQAQTEEVTVLPEIRESTAVGVNSATTDKSIAKPAGTVEGDLLIMTIAASSYALADLRLDSGFTDLGGIAAGSLSDPVMRVGYKVATASEPSRYTPVPPSGASYTANLAAIKVGTWDETMVPNVVLGVSPASNTQAVAPDIDPNKDASLLMVYAATRSTSGSVTFNWSPPSGMAEMADVTSPNGYCTMSSHWQNVESPDPTGTRTIGLARSNNDPRLHTVGSLTIPAKVVAGTPGGGGGGGTTAGTIPVYPAVRDSSSTSHSSGTGTATGETVPVPSGVQAGDLLVLYTVLDIGATTDITPPSAFTQLGEISGGSSLATHAVSYKVAGPSEPATYTYQNYYTSADGASLMVAIRDWDGVTGNLRYAEQSTTKTARAIPSITPAKGGLVLYSGAHNNAGTAADGIWHWAPPQKSSLVGQAHNTSQWSSEGVAQELATTTATISGRTWADANLNPAASAVITTALAIGMSSTTATALLGTYSAGSGGSPSDQPGLSFQDSTGRTSGYNLYAGGLDWTKDVGILIYTDGSAENGIRYPNDVYVMAGADGMIAVAKRHNMILLTPMAPGNGCNDGDGVCWYDSSADGTTPAQKLEWSRQLITYIYGRYNICKSRVAIGGYSSGAQWTTQFFGPAYAHEYMTDGVMVAISYGGNPLVTVANTTEFKTHVPVVWDVGSLDPAWTQPTWNGSVQRGVDYYSANGYETRLHVVEQVPHERYSATAGSVGEFGRIMERYIVQYVRPS